MTILLLIPTVLSLLLLAAHFMRSGSYVLIGASMAMLVLLFVRRAWAARILQVVLLLAAVEWVFTAINVAQQRQLEGRPAGRAMLIFIIVAGVNILAAFLYRTPRLAKRYRLLSPEPPTDRTRTSAPAV